MMILPAFGLVSCQSEDDEVFGDSSSQRLEQDMENIKDILRGAPNGWAMDYFVGTDVQYGGYVVTVKFDSLTCTAASELIQEEATSYYKMTSDQGPVLTFDTYNKVLHALATPSSSYYEGYHADFEFTVLSATPELVVLKGKRVGNYAYLRPIDVPMLDYIKLASAMSDSIYSPTAVGMIGEDSVEASFSYMSQKVTFTYSADTAFNETRDFVFTDKGLRLYTPVEVGGSKLYEFTYADKDRLYTCVNEGANGFSMTGRMPSVYIDYEDYVGSYWLYYQSGIEDDEEEEGKADSVMVTLSPLVDGRSYSMSGLNPLYTVEVGYDRGTSNLTWNTQIIAHDEDGNEIWFNAASWVQNTLPRAYTLGGFVTEWNGDRENPVYTWVDNGYTGIMLDTWCLWKTTPNNSSSLGRVTEGEYLFRDGESALYYISRMVKIK